MSEHEGRRARMRERFCRENLDHFAPHEVLELLLYYAIRRGDTNAVAHELMDTFGSLQGVLEASPERLKTVKGVGDEAATLLSMMLPLFRRYEMCKAEPRRQITSYDDAADYCRSLFEGLRVERFYIISLDNKGRVIAVKMLSEGSLDRCDVPPRKLAEIVLNHNASSVLLCHNHPGGSAEPSVEDIQMTFRMNEMLHLMDITLIDHVIVSEKNHVSLAKKGALKMIPHKTFTVEEIRTEQERIRIRREQRLRERKKEE